MSDQPALSYVVECLNAACKKKNRILAGRVGDRPKCGACGTPLLEFKEDEK